MSLLFPNNTKYRKKQKGSLRGRSKGGNIVQFGEFGIQALGRGRITGRQVEACRITVNRCCGRKGRVWIRVFPDHPVTTKPIQVRMGKGKGSVDHWVALTRPGRILFELGNVPIEVAKSAFRRAAAKLPIRTRFVQRIDHLYEDV